MSESELNTASSKVATVKFFYEKGTYYRVVHTDGCFGGVSPDGSCIVMNVFNERLTPPITQSYALDKNGRLSEYAEEEVGHNSVTREMEATLIMSPVVARAIHKWLGEYLDVTDELRTPNPTTTPSSPKENQ